MKTCLVIALVFAVGYAELDRAFKEKILKEIPDQINECAKKEETTKEDYENLMSGKGLTRRGAKCLLACIHEKDKILDKNGKLDLDGALRAIEPFKEADADIHAKLKQVFTNCIKSVGDLGDRCETSGKFNDCCNESYIDVGLSPDFLKV